mgnify:FL=1|jgi:hypothetical protein
MSQPMPTLEDLLRRTTSEIRRCRGVVIRLEDAVHGLVGDRMQPAAAAALRDLQAIDLLDQRLHDLALWTEALAATAGTARAEQSAADLSRGLLLAEMRHALGGVAEADAPAAGHTEFF